MIKVGDYIRNKEGDIGKVTNNNYYMEQYVAGGKRLYLKENIVNHSKNIMDLIEVGDIVETENKGVIRINNTYYLNVVKDNIKAGIDNIETILTKEQYDNNCFKVEKA